MKKMVGTNVLTAKQCLVFNVPFSANLAVEIRIEYTDCCKKKNQVDM